MSQVPLDPTDRSPGAEPHAAVLQLLAAAKYLKDAEDAVGFAEVWAQAAVLTIEANGHRMDPIVGRSAIMDFYQNSWARGDHGAVDTRETHVAEHPYIVATGPSQLRAVHNLIFTAMAEGEPILIGFATFTDDIIFEDGRWRIAARASVLRRRSRPAA